MRRECWEKKRRKKSFFTNHVTRHCTPAVVRTSKSLFHFSYRFEFFHPDVSNRGEKNTPAHDIKCVPKLSSKKQHTEYHP
ncbi:hypothetical protein CGRA01v4_00703 [Colletotrichum graminicola]|nr:hypothetical protein CGRA01v4_00703 [Colletotrichum graminicola]